jgi:perosamine synthetase
MSPVPPPRDDAVPSLDQFTFYRGRVAESAVLAALGIGRGDEVAIQAFTCVAVPEGVIATGARPVYVDVLPNGFTMDPADLAKKLTPRTRAIVVQHTFGIPTDMEGITRVAQARGIHVIEDCAHAVGSTIGGRAVGSIGVASFYSFEASKPVFVGIGGGLQVNDPVLADKVRSGYGRFLEPPLALQAKVRAMYHAHRMAYRPSTYWTVRSLYRTVSKLGLVPGSYNAVATDAAPATDFGRRLGALQRQLLPAAKARLAGDIPHRRRVAAQYRARLEGAGLMHPVVPDGADVVFGRYPLLVDRKDELLARAPWYNVEVAGWYATPVHPLIGTGLEAVAYQPGSCPEAEAVTTRVVTLTTGPLVDERVIERTARLFAAL